MPVHYELSRLVKYGHPPMLVMRRELETGSALLDVGAPYPIDWEDKKQKQRAAQLYSARRVEVSPDWLIEHVPGAARYCRPVAAAPAQQIASGKGKTHGIRQK